MELAKCTQEEKFSSRLGKELSLTVAEYVQNNLMDQLTERVKMEGTNNKKKEERESKTRVSQQLRTLLWNISTSVTCSGLFIIYKTESENFFNIPLLSPII